MRKVFIGAVAVYVSIVSILCGKPSQDLDTLWDGKEQASDLSDALEKFRASKPEGADHVPNSQFSRPKEVTKAANPLGKGTSLAGGATVNPDSSLQPPPPIPVENVGQEPNLSLPSAPAIDPDRNLNISPVPLSDIQRPEGLPQEGFLPLQPQAISQEETVIQKPFQLEIEDHERECYHLWPPKEGSVIVNKYKEKNWFESVEGELDYPQFSPLETMIHQHACWMKCDGRITLKELRVNGRVPPARDMPIRKVSLLYDSYMTLTKTRSKQLMVFVVQSLLQTLLSKSGPHPDLVADFSIMNLEIIIVNKSALVAYADPDSFRKVSLEDGVVLFDPWEKGACIQGEPYVQVYEEVRITCEAAAH